MNYTSFLFNVGESRANGYKLTVTSIYAGKIMMIVNAGQHLKLVKLIMVLIIF